MSNFIFLADSFNFSNPNFLIIVLSGILILSFVFNVISEKTNIPSVLMLILLGVLIQLVLKYYLDIDLGGSEAEVKSPDYEGFEDLLPDPEVGMEHHGSDMGHEGEAAAPSKSSNSGAIMNALLSVLGTIGLIMIVLEAALDLELKKEKMPLIIKSFLVALVALVLSTFGVAFALKIFIEMDFTRALIYATPLSIMSSAIIIPSVNSLLEDKKEFMIYESTFSDILGIMFFYFLINFLEKGPGGAAADFGISLILTLVVSVVAIYIIVYFFKDMKSHSKLSLLLAVLLLLYSAGKMMHLSPLLIILLFGLSLANHQTFFKVFKNDWEGDKEDPVERIEKEFHLITMETAFVVRTLFFVIFGMLINLASLVNIKILIISLVVLAALYAARFVVLKGFLKKDFVPELYIAPRGLITILLYYAILEHKEVVIDNFDSGILLYVIIISSLVMTYALVRDKNKTVPTAEPLRNEDPMKTE